MFKATQIDTGIKSAKVLVSVLAGLVISGCVSQQSSFDFNGTPIFQPVPTGATLAGSELETVSGNTDALTSTIASNIPQKAPRPTTNVDNQTTVEPITVVNANQVSPTLETPETANTLAIVETASSQAPTANVIADATATPQTSTVAIPSAKPTATTQTQSSVEVASLSPTVDAESVIQTPAPQVAKKKGFFETLFAPKEPKESTPRPVATLNKPKITRTARASSRIETANSVADRPSRAFNKPKIKKPTRVVATTRSSGSQNDTALPGVKSNSEIFGIKNEDGHSSGTSRTTQVAAVGSFGRLSPNGLRVQHSKVQVACIKPGVLRILKMVERRYGKKPIVTSGYRSPKGNRRAGGARNSQHIFCKAVDIQVEGVSKWKLAKYLRTLPGRGGVGTYCRTKSVHIDIGSVRDWHHPCRKSSKRKRKKA